MKHILFLSASIIAAIIAIFGFGYAINILCLIISLSLLVCDLHFCFDKWEWIIKLIVPEQKIQIQIDVEEITPDVSQEDFDDCYRIALRAKVDNLLSLSN